MYKKHAILYYISVILVARALGHDDRIDIILKGDPFISDGIMNFIEPDNFFDFIPQDHNVFKFIENALNKFDFTQKIGKDIFRVLYEDLITPSERHSLGEFYTPEWLAKILVDDVITEKNKIVLDPACGSGTFLREVILKKHELGETLDEIASEVIGFDINPIAVAISKATYLLTISEIDKKFKPNIIYVFLADSLMPLKDVKILKGKEVLENAITVNFDEILPGEGYYSFYYEPIWSIKEMTEYLIEISQTHEDKIHLNDGLINRIEKLAKQNKNHIWYYILRNIYTPYYFINKIDIVLGNPPWLTFKDIKNLDRQNFLNALYKSYELSSGSEYKTQIDMVEFFIVRSQEYLRDKENGMIAFILTRAILNG
jgi:SAM-dependent methyltransferase